MENELRDLLLELQADDIAMRRELIDAGELYQPGYHPRMAEVHRRNNAALRQIVERWGWPGIRLVGEDGCEAAWKIAQHAILDQDLQERCLELLKDAVQNGDAQPWQLAMLTDRVLMQQGKPQIYGTMTVGDGNDGVMLWKLAEPEKVDSLREQAGLPPLEANMRRIREEVNFVLDKEKAARKET